MMNTHYPAVKGKNRFLDSIGSADVTHARNRHNMTVNYNKSNDGQESSFERSGFLTQRRIDPHSLLPPDSLSVRDRSDKLRKDLTFPQSPAFVNIYKMNKRTELT